MSRYRLGVRTGSQCGGGTLGGVSLSLVGTLGVSPPCHLSWPRHRLSPGTTLWVQVTSPQPLGTLLRLRLHKEPLLSLVPDRWFCASVTVTGPLPGDTGDTGDTGDSHGDIGDSHEDLGDVPTATFPCHRWLESGEMELYEGTVSPLSPARTPREAAREPQLLQQRQKERRERREAFQWAPYAPGWPWCLRALPPTLCPWPAPPPPVTSPETTTSEEDEEMTSERPMTSEAPPPALSPTLSFPLAHRAQLAARAGAAQIRIRLRGLRSGISWSSFDDVRGALEGPGTPISEYVVQHWQEDAFFGEQFLSGVNPVLLRRCPRLPPNFPLSNATVAASLGPNTSLDTEMQRGRLFMADYAMLEGLPTGDIGGQPQFVAAPLCLLWLDPQDRLVPLAIQLSQRPGPRSPIFVRGAPGWALAKLWVRGAHFVLHEMVTHLLHGHFLAEVFAVATQRLPAAHPVHQLLLPHLRFTFHINVLARETLLNPGGIIDQATSVGRRGTLALVARATLSLRYHELCVPEDVAERGVGDIPGYHYRDDALDIWTALQSYVQGVVALFYGGDSDVAEDEELQEWVGEIFTYGVLGNADTGFPSRLCSRSELVRFLTMIIFCCSARHAAVNSGQYDYAAWMPNTPGTLQRPPPSSAAEATQELLLGTLPSPEATGALLALLSVVSYESGEPRPLGSRSQDLLTGAAPRLLLAELRTRLRAISQRIRRRNAELELPYPYLDPAVVQESISI